MAWLDHFARKPFSFSHDIFTPFLHFHFAISYNISQSDIFVTRKYSHAITPVASHDIFQHALIKVISIHRFIIGNFINYIYAARDIYYLGKYWLKLANSHEWHFFTDSDYLRWPCLGSPIIMTCVIKCHHLNVLAFYT